MIRARAVREQAENVDWSPIRFAERRQSKRRTGGDHTDCYDHHNRLTGVYDSTGTTRKAAFTWDALGRRIEFVNDVLAGTPTTRYYYDGVNEVLETDGAGTPANLRSYVHGVSYVDERLMMKDLKDSGSSDDRPYYYAVDRMYDVVMLIDRAGAIVERYCYDAYGRPFIRESCGRGDMDDDTDMDSTDGTRFAGAVAGTLWDPRADLDDDGDVDGDDQDLYDAKYGDWDWDPPGYGPSVSQAFSDVGNPYMFQGVPHFALDTAAEDTSGKHLLNHHRARFEDCATGRWNTRDPLRWNIRALMPHAASDKVLAYLPPSFISGWAYNVDAYGYLGQSPVAQNDPSGLQPSTPCSWIIMGFTGYGSGYTRPCKAGGCLGAQMCCDSYTCFATPGPNPSYYWAAGGGSPSCGNCATGTQTIGNPGCDNVIGWPG